MTKKKIRYSEFPTPSAESAPAVLPDAVATPVPQAEATPADAPVSAPRPRAPLDLARALAAARETEITAKTAASESTIAAAVAAASAARTTVGRLTPVRSSMAIPRLTPVRASVAIARPTPVRPSIAIVRDAPVPMPVPAAVLSTALRDRARARTGTVDLLIFGVGREWFGIELAVVEEAIDLPAVRHVPEMPPAMLGVITVRGTLTAVYSPAASLGVPLNDGASALVFRRARGRLGIAVDDVDDVHTLDLAQLRDAPAADAGDGVLLGVLRHRDTLLALVDAEALIAACQTVPALETA